MHKNYGSLSVPLHTFQALDMAEVGDDIAVEEPLEIRLIYQDEAGEKHERTISITMRTPGHDIDLALGFLYNEGVIQSMQDVLELSPCGPVMNRAQSQNIIRVKLRKSCKVELGVLERNNFTNSSCGVCGKTSLDAVRTKLPAIVEGPPLVCAREVILRLPELVRNTQVLFNQTGGVHASALFTSDGQLIDVREDVGRHNALDKLIGNALKKSQLPLTKELLLVSGRVSFELVQKASMAGISFMAAVGAPSSLALELACERGMTVVGFIRKGRFNSYCGSQRIL